MCNIGYRVGAVIARRSARWTARLAKQKTFPLRHLSLWAIVLFVFVHTAATIARKSNSILLGLIAACLIFVTMASICLSIFAKRR